ncbi:MAG TPA: undecaprenyl-diphosphate phosphatase [Candidatus Limnocylindria bacterium]|nr:undecaprenyl-diphosphate phosphatase [Candidatus Limnocylindria bacterium]
MSPVQAAVLGALQGVTEFLPISSSAHLYLIPTLLGWRYEGVAFDVALHWGTLIALLAAFGRDWVILARDAWAREPERRRVTRALWLKLAIASVPAAVVGLLVQDVAETHLRSVPLQAVMLAVFGFLLWWVDRVCAPGTEQPAPGWRTCLVVGFAQALALVPGVSRSGVTMTAGRATGLSRVSAARFSFLLAMPITFGAGLLELRHLSTELPAATLAIGVGSAALTGFLAIRGLIRWLGRAGFGAFFAYRLLLAAVILFLRPA